MKRERLRADGRCLNCKGPRTPQKGLHGQTGVLAHLFAQEVERDPFCSSSCCRAYHKCTTTTTLGRPNEKAAA